MGGGGVMVPGVFDGISPEGIFGINPEGEGMVTDGVVGVLGFEAIPPSPIDKCSAVMKEGCEFSKRLIFVTYIKNQKFRTI